MKKGSREIYFKNAILEVKKEAIQVEVAKLRKKWGIPNHGFRESESYDKWFNALISEKILKTTASPSLYSVFLNEIEKTLLPIANKPSYWRYFFVNYLTTGLVKEKITYRSGNTPLTPKIKLVENVLSLEINSNTTLEDIQKSWSKIHAVQKTLPDYYPSRRKRKLDRDLELLNKTENQKLKKYYDSSIPNDEDEDFSLEASHKALQRIRKAVKGH